MDAMRRACCALLVAGAAVPAMAMSFDSAQWRCGYPLVTPVECDCGSSFDRPAIRNSASHPLQRLAAADSKPSRTTR